MSNFFSVKSKGKRRQVLVQNIKAKNPFSSPYVKERGGEFLVFDPLRSKLAASIMLGFEYAPQKEDVILYLGASAGYTVSFLAQHSPLIFAVEFAPVMARDLVFVAEDMGSIAPILADASHPSRYAHKVCLVDYLFQDVSQRNQVSMFIDNCKIFLKPKGIAVLSLKTRSVDVKKSAKEVLDDTLKTLEKEKGLKVLDHLSIHRFEKDHYVIAVQRL